LEAISKKRISEAVFQGACEVSSSGLRNKDDLSEKIAGFFGFFYRFK
jgi:hypothetical protein